MKEDINEKSLEISKMLTLSTAHIKKSTADFLNDSDGTGLISYMKKEFGWFIYLNTEYIKEIASSIPEDLERVIKFAQDNDCLWLCLDRDGNLIKELPAYEWY